MEVEGRFHGGDELTERFPLAGAGGQGPAVDE
jgi:hypothetical protein